MGSQLGVTWTKQSSVTKIACIPPSTPFLRKPAKTIIVKRKPTMAPTDTLTLIGCE